MHTMLWWEFLNERGHLEDLSVGGKMIFKWRVQEQDGRVWIAFN